MTYIIDYEKRLLDNLKKAKDVAVDTETISLTNRTMVGFSFAYEDYSFYVPVKDKYLKNMPKEKALQLLNFILQNCNVIFHNSSFDIPVLFDFGAWIPDKEYEDTVLMANLVDENVMHGLKKLARELKISEQICPRVIEFKEICGTGKKRMSFDEVKDMKKVEYACADARMTLEIYKILSQKLAKDPQSRLVYDKIEKPLLNVVADMHINGITIDVDQVFRIGAICSTKVAKAEEKLKILMGKNINFNSSKQLREYFIDKINMPIIKKSEKTGEPSVDKEVLKRYAETNGTAKLLLEYRKYNKILTTFIPALTPTKWEYYAKTGKRNGKIFASFNQAGTVSGRFSSSHPNMQNIPRDEKPDNPEYLGIRECFIPEEGHIFIGADYSQIELRVLAHYSQDVNLMNAYIHKKDIHQQTADALGIDRQNAKTINFGLVYGMGNKTLAKQIEVSEDIAQEYIDRYFDTYKGVRIFWEDAERQFKTFGFVQTISGRKRRRTKHFYVKDDYEQGAEIRSAVNSIIQGTAADLIKMSMITMAKEFKPYGAKLILTVHDEVLVSCPIKNAEAVHDIIKNAMIEAGKALIVPVDVDVHYGYNWAQAHSATPERILDLLGKTKNPKKINSRVDRDKLNGGD